MKTAQAVLDLHESMRKLTLEAGVSDRQYKSVVADIDVMGDAELRLLEVWLKSIREREYEDLKNTWALVPEEMWSRYELFNIKGLQEQALLRDARRALRDVWRIPYRTEHQIRRRRQKKSTNRHQI